MEVKMQKLNQGNVTQLEAFRLVGSKLNELWSELLSSNSFKTQVVHFDLSFILQEGSVKGSVYFDEVAKLK